jgi:hypothetical protein
MRFPNEHHQIPTADAHSVWFSEDGRCEACGRPMDKATARFIRHDWRRDDYRPDNLRLLCIDCKERWPAPFDLGVEFSDKVKESLGGDIESLARRLEKALAAHGVIITVFPGRRVWWLPGIGMFRIEHRPFQPARILRMWRIEKPGQLRIQPQARTRGLPHVVRTPRKLHPSPVAVSA